MIDDTSTAASAAVSTNVDATVASSPVRTAGSMLREARQAQGTHIATLAAAMKVSQKKLEALEADRIDELPDATFARALAQSVCRTLKIDAAPVLALLPQQKLTGRLEHVSSGINEPFRDHAGRRDDGDWRRLRSPAIWLPLLLLIAAAGIFLAPQGLMLRFLPASSAASGAGSASGTETNGKTASVATGAAQTPGTVNDSDGAVFPPSEAASAASTAIASGIAPPKAAVPATATTTASAPAVVAAFARSMADAAASTVSRVAAAASVEAASLAGVGPLELHARTESWVEVQDSHAKVLIGRTLGAGETVFVDGSAPFHVKIGNASSTELVYHGHAVDLAASTRDNVARLELK